MAYNYLAGQSIAQLAAALASAQSDLLAAKSRVSVTSGDVAASFSITQGIQQRIQQIYDALTLLDPITYPAQIRVSRTHAIMYSGVIVT